MDTNFVEQKNKFTTTPIFLYKIINYNGLGSDLRYALWNADVVWNSETYTRELISHDKLSQNQKGEIDAITVTLQNVDLVNEAFQHYFDFREKRIQLIQIWDEEKSSTNFKREIFIIDSVAMNEMSISLSCSSNFNHLALLLPRRTFRRSDFPGIKNEGGL